MKKSFITSRPGCFILIYSVMYCDCVGVMWLFLTIPCVGQLCMIVVFLSHTSLHKDCVCSFKLPPRGGSNENPQPMYWIELRNKYQTKYVSKICTHLNCIHETVLKRQFK